jgi:hypothetical protein
MAGLIVQSLDANWHANHYKFITRLNKYYPRWPWVKLGSIFVKPGRSVAIPDPLGDAEVKQLIDDGRLKWQEILETNENNLNNLLTEKWAYDISGESNDSGKYADYVSAWSESRIIDGFDNRGFVKLTPTGKTVNDAGRPIDRRHDYILSVLECLSVGSKPVNAWHQTPRTASSIFYPYGPNTHWLIEQDKSYLVAMADAGISEDAPVRNTSINVRVKESMLISKVAHKCSL